MQRTQSLFVWLILSALLITHCFAANSTTTTLSVSSNAPRLGQTITLTATVASPASGNVTFYDGTAVVGIASVKSGAAALSTSALASGKHVLQARYDGDAGDAKSLSGTVTVTVQSALAMNFYALPPFGSTAVSSAITADFNNDHIPDLVTIQQDDSVSVYLGNGDGTFGAATALAISAVGVTTGDFNGDGNVDLAFTVQESDTVAIFFGVGYGTFTGPTMIAVPGDGNLFAIQSTDFNGDGLVDILVSRYQSIALLPGNGNGTFGAAVVTLTPSLDIDSLLVDDFNGDGTPDVITVSSGYGDYFVAGAGDGTFGVGVQVNGIFASYALTAADFNGDGKLDLLSCGSGYGTFVLPGNGDGTFGTPITLDFGYTAVADVNGDGKLDLVSGTNVGYGNGDGTFQPTVVFSSSPANLLAVADLNNNGQVDLISSPPGSTGMTVFLGTDLSTITLSVSPNHVNYNSPIALSATVTPVTATGTVTFYDGSTAIGSAPISAGFASLTINAPYSGHRIYTAQYSGDSVTRFSVSPIIEVTVNGTFTNTVLAASSVAPTYGQAVTLTATVTPGLASGTVTFYDGGSPLGAATVRAGIASLPTSTLPTGTHALTAQYDGGGSYSLSSSAPIAVTVSSLAAGAFNGPVSVTGGLNLSAVYSADLNLDGIVDLIVTGQNIFRILLGTGSGTFRAPVTYNLSAPAINVLVGDLNNDGSPDLIVQSSTGLTFTLGNGDGTFRTGGSLTAANRFIATGDINRDGRLDLILAYSSGTVSLLLGNGDGTFQSPLTINSALGITALAIGDFNGDGNPDLVLCGSSSISGFSGVLEYLGNGDGTFSAPLTAAQILNPIGMALGDLNRDGKLDLVVSTNFSFVSLLGNGAGGFTVAGTFSEGALLPLLLADINGDGVLDVIGNEQGDLQVFFGLGDGTFSFGLGENVGGVFALGDFFHTGRVSVATRYNGTVGLLAGSRPATETISASPSPGTLGQPVTISVSISPSDATGTVTFYLGYSESQSLGTSPVVSGVATITTSTLAANRNVITPSYSGDSITAPVYDYYIVVPIIGLPSSLTLSTSSPAITFGHPLTLTASINPVVASGVVTFFAGTKIIGSAPLQNGVATLSSSSVPAGISQLRAVYEGNSTYTAGIASSLVPVRVNAVAGSAFTFVPSVSPLYGSALASGDFNGDRIQDILVQFYSQGYASNLQVLLGQGDGTFQAGPLASVAGNFVGSSYFPVVAVDLNGDGKLDLVAPNYFELAVYLNNGDGTFGQPLYTYFEADALATTDVNGDGIPDLVALDFESNLQVLTGFGDGTFLPLSATFAKGTNTSFSGNIVVADFNGDGKSDLAIGGYDTNSTSIFLGNGDSTFQAPIDVALGATSGQSVSTDLNGDGIPDLAIITGTTNNTVTVLIGKGDGTFQTPISYSGLDNSAAISASDFNGDGKMDVVVVSPNSTAVLYGSGDGTLQIANVFPQTPPGLFVADYNGDGRADLPTLSGSLADTISFSSSASSPNPGQPVTLTASVAPTSASGTVTFYDGAIVLGNVPIVNGIATLTIQLPANGFQQITAKYQGDGSYGYQSAAAIPVTVSGGPGGVFTSAVSYATGANPTAIVTADFNHDGKLDLAVANANDNTVSVLWGNGNGTFGSTSTFATGTNPVALAAGDFNGDGVPDLAIANAGSNDLTILLSSGGSLIPGTTVSLGYTPYAIAVGDVNGDGRVDIVGSEPLFGNGDGTFTPSLNQPFLSGDSGLLLNDFNGDGNADVFFASNTLYFGDGHGNFQETIVYELTGNIFAAADFNHDGKLDIAFVSYNSAAVSIAIGKGDGTFLPAVSYPTPTSPIYLATGDFNGDGFADIVLVNSSGTVGLMLGNGDGTFNPEVSFLAGTQPVAIAVGDFNGDGRLDLAVPNAGSNNVSVLLGASTGCTFTVAPSSFLFDEVGGNATVKVTASSPNCQWSANFVASYNLSSSETASGVGNGTFTFLIPPNNSPGGSPASATIDVANQQIPVTVRETATQFADVPASAYYFDAVNLLKQYNITAGCGSGDFCPDDTVTRAEMAIFVVRGILGTDDFTYTLTPYFTDVPANAFGFQWIQKLRDLGITSGCGTNVFCPNDAVTRSQVAIFLIRARYGVSTGFPYSTVPFFTDVPTDEYAFPWIQRMEEDNITAGCTATTYCPESPVTRGDMAIFIMRALFNQLLPASEPVILSPSYSAASEFLSIIGVNSHFVQGSTQVTVPGLVITGITVSDSTYVFAQATRDLSVPAGPESVVVITGQEVAVGPNLLDLQ